MKYDCTAAKARRKELIELIVAAADEITAIDAALSTLHSRIGDDEEIASIKLTLNEMRAAGGG